MSRFLTELDTRNIDGRRSRVLAPLAYYSNKLPGVLIVPPDFVTDWASIPQAVQSIIPRNGLWDWAAVIHDLLYAFNGAVPVFHKDGRITAAGLDREGADLVLLEAMECKGVGERTRSVIFEGVRVGGVSAWNEHAGESRIYPVKEMAAWFKAFSA